ncbi:MAG TPA: hypothetical protein VGI67_20690 [Thermoleophilaceae bacterium]
MVFVLAIGFLFVGLALFRLSKKNGGGDDTPGDDGPPWRRRGPRPRGPVPRGGPDPAWWPEFEREFRVYAQAQSGGGRPVTGVGS